MKRWEYKVIRDDQLTESKFNKLGKEGWHLAFIDRNAIGGRVIVFERELVSTNKPSVYYTDKDGNKTKVE